MPMANTRARNMTLRPNSEPRKTISADIPTSSMNVFAVLAAGCQVIEFLLRANALSPEINVSNRPRGSANRSAVPVNRVVHQRRQRPAARSVGQPGQLVTGLEGITLDGGFG